MNLKQEKTRSNDIGVNINKTWLKTLETRTHTNVHLHSQTVFLFFTFLIEEAKRDDFQLHPNTIVQEHRLWNNIRMCPPDPTPPPPLLSKKSQEQKF